MKPSSVIYTFRLACRCGGEITLSNEASHGELQYGSTRFRFQCSKCRHAGIASFSRRSVYSTRPVTKEQPTCQDDTATTENGTFISSDAPTPPPTEEPAPDAETSTLA